MHPLAIVDVAWDTQRRRVPLASLDVGDLSSSLEVKRAVERHLGLGCGTLSRHVVLRFTSRRVWIRLPLVRQLEAARASVARAVRVLLRPLASTIGAGLGRLWIAAGRCAAPSGRVLVAVARTACRAFAWICDVLGRTVDTFAAPLARALGRALTGAWGRMLEALGCGVDAVSVRLSGALRRAAGVLSTVFGQRLVALGQSVDGLADALGHVALAILRAGCRVLVRVRRRVDSAAAAVRGAYAAVLRAVDRAFRPLADRVACLARAARAAMRAVGSGVRRIVEQVDGVRAKVVRAALSPVARLGRIVQLALVAAVRAIRACLRRLVARALVPLRSALVRMRRLVARVSVPLRSALLRTRRLVGRVSAPLCSALVRLRAPLRRAVRTLRHVTSQLRAWVFGLADTILTGRTPEERERDHRAALFDALLSSAHRRLQSLHPAHASVARRDPLFYVRLAAWYAVHGEGRDQLEMFVVVLVTSELPELREVGLALLRRLPPYEVGRVVDFIRGRVIRRRSQTVREGLFRNPSRSLRTEVERYLREREASPQAFDGAALAARESLKRLYSVLHIRPSPRAQAILFDRQPPADSRLSALGELRKAATAEERARIVREARLPYRVASSVLPAAEVGVLLEQMTPGEVINHMQLLRRRGVLDDAVLRDRVDDKLRQATEARRVSTFKAVRAAEGLDEEWATRLRAVTESRIKAHGRLRQSTALLIDASASMQLAIEVGRRIAAMLAIAADAPLYAYAFNGDSLEIVPRVGRGQAPVTVHGPEEASASMGDWLAAFADVQPGGPTSPGAAVLALLRAGRRVDQIVLVSDQQENQRPRLVPALRLYARRLSRGLRVVFVNLGDATDVLERECARLRLEVASWRFSGDDYAIPDLLPLIVRPTRTQLVLDIMSAPLPRRQR